MAHSKYKPDDGSAAKYDLFEQAQGLMHVSNRAEERAEGFNEYFAQIALHISRCNFIIFRINKSQVLRALQIIYRFCPPLEGSTRLTTVTDEQKLGRTDAP